MQARSGHGLAVGTLLGPLINAAAVQKSARHVHDAMQRGAKCLAGGGHGTSENNSRGNFYPATVLRDVAIDSLVMREESFGPVAAVVVSFCSLLLVVVFRRK